MKNMKNGSLSDDAIMMGNYHIYYCINVIKRVCVVCRSCGQKYIHQLAFT